jgi:ribosomal protein L25 (general stress protein Ctc)
MAQGKGGVYGSFVMVRFKKGTSKKFDKDGKLMPVIPGYGSSKSHYAMVKQPIAKYFGFDEVTPADLIKESTRKINTTIQGKAQEVTTMVKQGATGASRSVTVRFTKLVTINKKKMASIKIAMPSSHTFSNMVQEIMETKNSGDIAAIVSNDGSSMTFKTPYNPKKVTKVG